MGQVVSGTCVDLSYEGYGVFKFPQGVVFVKGMFPGDEGEVVIDYRRNGQFFGHIQSLSMLSDDRITPLCKVCTACGGCTFQAYEYRAELRFKERMIADQFRRIAKMEVNVQPIIGMENPVGYRNKIQVPFGWNKWKNQAIYGFYRHGTHEIIPNNSCLIEDPRATRILQSIRNTMNRMNIYPYDESDGSGTIRHVLIRTSRAKEEIMVIVVAARRGFPRKKEFYDSILRDCPEITTLIQNENHKRTNVILGDWFDLIHGPGYIEDVLMGLTFRISPGSFYQTNPIMTEKLYSKAVEAAKLTGEEVVLDAYSGIGTIGLSAAKNAKQVIGVEIVHDAVLDAEENAKLNSISNFVGIEMDATEYIEQRKEPIDVLFMDPPRSGSTERFLDAVKRLKPKRIVYVSCGPSSLARDVARLADLYEIESIQPMDMFPRTAHVETVAALSRKD